MWSPSNPHASIQPYLPFPSNVSSEDTHETKKNTPFSSPLNNTAESKEGIHDTNVDNNTYSDKNNIAIYQAENSKKMGK